MSSGSTTTLPRTEWATWRVCGPIVVWLAALVASWCWMNHYEFGTNPPLTQASVTHWPVDSQLTRTDHHATLLLFLHPKCPCSRASISELERLWMTVENPSAIDHELIIVATVPVDADEQWLQTDTIRRAQSVSNARLFVDRGGVEAARFAATTSGLVMVFNQRGERQYAGGVTVSRGHEGDNVGRDCVAQILLGHNDIAREIPAFGCRLCLPEPPAAAAESADPATGRATRASATFPSRSS